MSKYRIVKHRAGDSIGYCPEIWECPISIWGVKESWRKLAGNENLTSLDLWVWSLPETMEEAKSIIEKHIEDQKPKYSEEVVYEYDTEKKEKQKKLLTEIIEADQKNGLYDISDEQKNMTAVEWLLSELQIRLLKIKSEPNGIVREKMINSFLIDAEQAEAMEIEHLEDCWIAAEQCEDSQTFFNYYNETYNK